MKELSLVGTQQGYPKERIKQKIKVSIVDMEIKQRDKGYPIQEFPALIDLICKFRNKFRV